MTKPDPREYGLPADYDWRAKKGRIKSAESRIEFMSGCGGFLVGCGGAILVVHLLYLLIGNWSLWALPVLFLGGIGVVGGLLSKALKRRMIGDVAEQAKAYGEALEAYEYQQLETGIGFWKALRGVPFEQAVARLFNKRGCKAQTTTTTGDGGIDIILTVAGQTFWGQCKGHASPISVAPIREIAGVCSKSTRHPVVFAVNGYTKAARKTAAQLGVLLIDAPQIAALAEKDRISAI